MCSELGFIQRVLGGVFALLSIHFLSLFSFSTSVRLVVSRRVGFVLLWLFAGTSNLRRLSLSFLFLFIVTQGRLAGALILSAVTVAGAGIVS